MQLSSFSLDPYQKVSIFKDAITILQRIHFTTFWLLLINLGNCAHNLEDRLVKFQKRAARIIIDKDFDTPSADLFLQLNWMTFPERVNYQKAILMFKVFNNQAPVYLKNLFVFTSDIQKTCCQFQNPSSIHLNQTVNSFAKHLFTQEHTSGILYQNM